MPDTLYRSHSIEKTHEGISGSLTLWEDSPVSPFDVGDTFSPITDGPVLSVEKVSIKDNVLGEYNGKLLRQWEINIEGSNNSSGSAQTHVKYNFNISADEKSGTMEVTNTGDNPAITLNIGDVFSVPGIGAVFCTNVKGNDEYDSSGVHTWTVIYEGSNKASIQNAGIKFTINVENNSDGVTIYSGSQETTYIGAVPAIAFHIGDTFSLPYIGNVVCTRIQTSNIDANTWSVIIEGSRGGSDSSGDDGGDTFSLPGLEDVTTRELNGEAVRTVDGEFVILRRSQSPIFKRTLTIYSNSYAPITTIGATYGEGTSFNGTVLRETISNETFKNNGVVTASYYKHVIEVEA